MTQQHTPGPWNKVFDWSASINNIQSGSAVQVGTSYFVRHSDPEMKIPEADASLIAAAPDLLEALERLVDMVEDVAAMNDQSPEEYPGYERGITAIAKARGDI